MLLEEEQLARLLGIGALRDAVFVNHGAVGLDPEGGAVGVVLEFANRGCGEVEGPVRLMGHAEFGAELDGAAAAAGHGGARR